MYGSTKTSTLHRKWISLVLHHQADFSIKSWGIGIGIGIGTVMLEPNMFM